LQAVLKHKNLNSISSPAKPGLTVANRTLFLSLLAAGAVLVHGYHPFVEDAEIYVPGIKKLLNPALYPVNQGFFASHAGMTFYPNLIAWSSRISQVPLPWTLLAWHFLCILLLLAGCWKLGSLCFRSERAAWGGAILVASLLTIPVAGTALYIMDQYMNPRSFSTATAVWIVASALQKKFFRAAVWIALTALVHPLMSVFSLGFILLMAARERIQSTRALPALLLPAVLFPPVTAAYKRAIDAHSYFFILRWEWFEWLGIVGPMVIFWFIAKWAKRRRMNLLETLCVTTAMFCFLCVMAALAITIPPQFVRFAELQPMRGLLLAYVFLIVASGGLLAEYVLRDKLWRWTVLAIPICGGMLYAQRQLFPATHHLEIPGRTPANPWVQTFEWIKGNTPPDAYFALNPEHMRMPGEDQHGFRAIAERSMLADAVKDSGAVTMFPALAQTWQEQVNAQRGWNQFGREDFEKLRDHFGVTWFVLESPQTNAMDCPYHNAGLYVCRIPIENGNKAQ
jgi:hypothetical protein